MAGNRIPAAQQSPDEEMPDMRLASRHEIMPRGPSQPSSPSDRSGPGARISVQFAHGLEGSPHGRKARVLAEHFDAFTPGLDTSDFEACVRLHGEVLQTRRCDVLVGSSFGGAVAATLVARGQWTGPTLLLAPAVRRRGLALWLDPPAPLWIVHGEQDDVVPLEDSVALERANRKAGARLIVVEDGHALHTSTLSGRLEQWIRELAGLARGRPAARSPGEG